MIPAMRLDELPMRVGLGQFNELSEERLAYIKQCGVDDIQLNTPRLPGECRWEYEDLAAWREQVEQAGLRLMSLENVPVTFYDRIMLGMPGRDEQLDHMVATVRNMGRAGIPILGYHFMPTGVWRTSRTTPVRGGALATAYDHGEATSANDDRFQHKNSITHPGRDYTLEEMWDNYDWYLQRILPACEEAGVPVPAGFIGRERSTSRRDRSRPSSVDRSAPPFVDSRRWCGASAPRHPRISTLKNQSLPLKIMDSRWSIFCLIGLGFASSNGM